MKSTTRNQVTAFSLFVCLILASPFALAQSKRAMTFEDILSLRAASDPRISPDGRFVAFVVTQADMKTNFRNSDLWLVAADAGEPRQITNSPRRDDSPQWSPDSRRIAFISDREGKAQVYVIAIDGGEAQKLTDVKTSVQSFEWSPDGKRIAYIAADPPPESREKEKKDGFDQIVVDADYQNAGVSLIDVGSGQANASGELPRPVRVTSDKMHVTDISWHPGGDYIALTARNTPKLADSTGTEIYVAYVKGDVSGPPLRVTTNDRAESNITWMRDGETISYLSSSDKYPTIGPSRVHLSKINGLDKYRGQSAAGSFAIEGPKVLQPQFDGYITRHEWSSDGRFIYFAADLRAGRHIGRISSDGAKLEVQSSGVGLEGPFTLSAKTGRVAYIKEDPTHPADVWIASVALDPKGGSPIINPRQLTRLNPQADGFALGRAEAVRWKSKDGREIEGVLVYPIDYDPNKRFPLVTSIHGGPEGAYTLSFMAGYGEFPHVYAARGYASFFPNFRGSSNYGTEFASANVGDLGGGDYEDVMSGIDYLIERGIADPARLAVKGYSYGGYLSGWIIGHTNRFKAAVFGAGLSNAISYYSTADIQYQREILHQGTPWRDNQNMIERSPVMYLQNAKTPSLIYHGEKDERVPLGQSLETYMGLKKANATTQLVIYPREGHGLREPKHQLDKMRREIEWIEKYVRGE
jgi:dipeptidyl aminopeptidase/acylaminoacyl peptidase